MTELVDRISAALVGLKMPRALEALSHTLHRLEQSEITAVEAIDALLSEDCAVRETRRIDIALRTSKLVPVKTVESFDFAFQPSLDRERIAALAQLDFIRRREVVHFLGPPGTGKSHLATALGVNAVKAGKSVYRTTLAEPADSLAKAERQGQLAEKIRFLGRAALLIVDEIGCLPITQGGASLFFQIVNSSCEKGAMILTSNRGFAEWGDIFGAPSSRQPSSTGSSTTRSSSGSKAQATGSGSMPTSFPNRSARTPRSCRRPRRKKEAGRKGDPRRLNWLAPETHTNWGILLRHFWGILLRHCHLRPAAEQSRADRCLEGTGSGTPPPASSAFSFGSRRPNSASAASNSSVSEVRTPVGSSTWNSRQRTRPLSCQYCAATPSCLRTKGVCFAESASVKLCKTQPLRDGRTLVPVS